MDFSAQYITTVLVRFKRSSAIAKWLFFFCVCVNILDITSGHFADIENASHWELVVTAGIAIEIFPGLTSSDKQKEGNDHMDSMALFLRLSKFKNYMKKVDCRERISI